MSFPVSSSFPTWQTIPNHVFRSLSSPTGTQPYAIVQSMISLKMLRMVAIADPKPTALNERNSRNHQMANVRMNIIMVHRPHPNLYAKKEIGTTTNHTMSSSSHVLPRFALDSRHSEGCFSVYTCWSAMHSKAVCLGLIFPNQTL